MNRSQAVSAGVWYNPTPEQRRELKERAAAMRSPQRRKVLSDLTRVQLRLVDNMGPKLAEFVAQYASGVKELGARANAHEAYERDQRSAANTCATEAAYAGARASMCTIDELRAIRNMLDEVAQ